MADSEEVIDKLLNYFTFVSYFITFYLVFSLSYMIFTGPGAFFQGHLGLVFLALGALAAWYTYRYCES